MQQPIKIAVVDDNSFLIRAVKDKLSFYNDITVAFTASSGRQVLNILKEKRNTDLILMDIEMPEMDGIRATAMVKKLYPQIKVLMLTVFDDDENIFKAIQSGADGYLLKETAPQDLYSAIIQTMAGGAAMTPSIALKALNLLRSSPASLPDDEDDLVQLTNREIEVLEQLSAGLPYTSIAENLFISPSTVRRHIENIYRKLQVHSKVEAIEQAKKRRIL
ncbi:two component transcriptional regulator, LuxR family [Mariniphaga anaerophila]|uniref:Two component transcriptional regulator, LuxR family n=1 Tax=Mariniphaga anaerophila TaxID=1484053 RepID=A0A1M5E7S6_9BACT|nr:response regulator transcription factor [Mariniphaga anaerophila]SHF75246.1 two component transcriptional regulator, LuxR family [Mariniphaga anaerophila]